MMFLVLIGPKGSGKSHIGRLLERNLGVRFFHVEPLWMEYHAACAAEGRQPSIPEGIRRVHPHIAQALAEQTHVCVETTGASPEILDALLTLAPAEERGVLRLEVPLNLCLERIEARDPTHQIPLDRPMIEKVHALSEALELPAALTLRNLDLRDEEILMAVCKAFPALNQ